jgi:hypothetical protein
MIRQLGKNLGVEVRDTIRASQMDPTDVKGFPAPDAKKGIMRWLPPGFLPTDPKSSGILFLDELTSGAIAVQASFYQLMLDRRVGDYVLPDGWAVVAAGNREIDRSIVNRMPAALANRMVHIDYEVDVPSFVEWAMKNNIGAETIAFIRFREALLHNFNPDSKEAAFATPRTWEMADGVRQLPIDSSDKLELLKGTVGEGPAAEYTAFCSMINQLPAPEEIAMDPLRAPVPEAPGAQYAVTTMLSIGTKTVDEWRTNMLYMARMPTEFQVVYVRDLLNNDNVPIKGTREWSDWALANREVIA